MSTKALSWAMSRNDLTSAEKIVLIKIADSFSDVDGFSTLSKKEIANFAMISVRHVSRVITSLAAKNVLLVEHVSEIATNGSVRNYEMNRYHLAVSNNFLFLPSGSSVTPLLGVSS